MTVYMRDRVKQQTRILSTTPTVELLDVVKNYQSFAGAGLVAGNTFPYLIESDAVPEWEVGIGTLLNATSFTRTSVTASSNGGAATDFTSGIKYVSLIPSAANMQAAVNPTAPSFADVTGTISLTQVPSIPTTKVTGTLPNNQLPASPTFTNLIVSSLRINIAPTADVISTVTHHVAININGTVYNLLLSEIVP